MPVMTVEATQILLVEDDDSVRRSLAEFLEDHALPSTAVETLAEARQALEHRAPPVCLLDMNLPDGSGIDLLSEIARRRLPMRVIVMTAYPVRPLVPDFAMRHLSAWMTKPVAPEQLLTEVRTALLRGPPVP